MSSVGAAWAFAFDTKLFAKAVPKENETKIPCQFVILADIIWYCHKNGLSLRLKTQNNTKLWLIEIINLKGAS